MALVRRSRVDGHHRVTNAAAADQALRRTFGDDELIAGRGTVGVPIGGDFPGVDAVDAAETSLASTTHASSTCTKPPPLDALLSGALARAEAHASAPVDSPREVVALISRSVGGSNA
jgi:hypothetical protein